MKNQRFLLITLIITFLCYLTSFSYAQIKYRNNKLPEKLIEEMLKNDEDLALEFQSLYKENIKNLIKDVEVKRIDLNNDKILDYIILVKDYRFCGTGGCSFVYFYIKQSGDSYLNVSAPDDDRGIALLELNLIRKLDKIVNGYYVLEAKVKDSSPGIVPLGKVVLEFDGKQYIGYSVKKKLLETDNN